MTTSGGHVPVHINLFVGRVAELEQLGRYFQLGARLVTVAGPGGAGKTRLAAEFARRHRESGGRVIFVDLTRHETVGGALGAMLGVSYDDREGLIRALGVRAGSDLVLVLDNLEHVVEDAALMVPRLLALPSVRILGTSREPLRLGGEQVVRLGALSELEAFELFELRAKSVIPEFTVGDQSRVAIAEIVDRVDRLPLAIELAASRVNVLSPQGLAERLTSRMSALKSKDRDRPERHRTVAATAQWSWELLNDVERTVLRQLTVFRSGFEFKDAERVVEVDGVDALDVIEDLVDRSMIERGDGRTLRLYGVIYGLAAAELQSSGDVEGAYRRHGDHFARLVFSTRRHLRGVLQPLLPELTLAAQRTTGEIQASAIAAAGAILCEIGGVQTILDGLEGALSGAKDPKVLAELSLAAGVARLDRIDLDGATEKARYSKSIARSGGLPEVEVQAMVLESLAASWGGDHAGALNLLEHALAVAQDASELHAELKVCGNLVLALAQLGRDDDARDVAEAALMRARGSGDDLGLARVLVNLGLWHVDAGRWSEAIPLLTEAQELLDEQEDHRFLAHALLGLAKSKFATGETDEARGLYIRADHMGRDFGQIGVRLDALIGLGSIRESPSDRVYLVKAVDLAMNAEAKEEELIARSMLMLFDLRFGAFPLARHQARRVVGDKRVPESWSTTISALAALVAGGSGDVAEVPEAPADDSWLARLIRAVHAMVNAGAAAGPETAAAIADARRCLDELEESTPGQVLSNWPAAHVNDVLRTVFDDRFARVDVKTLRLHPEGRFFQPPGAEVVDFSRRGALRRILVGMGQARLRTPGRAIPLDDVLEIGWPGEIVTADAGAARVYSAIRTLRNHGLEDVLQTSDEGYFFATDVAVVFDENLGR